MPSDILNSRLTGNGQALPCSANSAPDSLWLLYIRLIGISTCGFVAIATPLHEVWCNLRSETLHWEAAALLMVLASVMAVALFTGGRRQTPILLVSASICLLTLMGSLQLVDFCEIHQGLLLCLLAVCLASILGAYTQQRLQTGTAPTSNPYHQAAALRFQPMESDSRPMAAESNSPVEPLNELRGDPSSDPSSDESANQSANDPSNESAQAVAARPTWTRYVVAATLLTGFLVYMIVVPAVGMLIKALSATSQQSYTLTDMTLSETIRLHSVSGVVMLIFLSIGASLGSFLNVVIYRLPRRRTLFWPPSACPQCLNKISGIDNVPVLSWLNLGGRCRFCAVKISARYPLVESLVAGLFVLFFYHELLSGGQNLPVRQPNSYNGIVWILLYTKWDLVGIYFFHMLLLILLLAWGMINYDRFRVPWHAAALSWLLLSGMVVLVPTLNPLIVGWNSTVSTVPASLLVTGVGGICGLALGAVLERLRRSLAGSSQTPEGLQQTLLDPLHPLPAIPSTDETVAVVTAHELSVSDELPSSESESLGEESGSVESSHELYGSASTTPQSSGDASLSLGLVGVAMGVEAVVLVAVATCVLAILSYGLRSLLTRISRMRRERTYPLSLIIFASTATLLVVWGQVPTVISLWFMELGRA